jgi:hypothetical protein
VPRVRRRGLDSVSAWSSALKPGEHTCVGGRRENMPNSRRDPVFGGWLKLGDTLSSHLSRRRSRVRVPSLPSLFAGISAHSRPGAL